MKSTNTPFRTLVLCALGFGVSATAQAAFVPVAVTGFNADVVANGTGAVTASSTDDVDGGAVGNRFNFMAPTFIGSTGVAPTTFLPATGLINSAATTGLPFQLAAYTANNSLRIAATGTGTLTFTTPQAGSDVYLLATSGNGASTFNATVTFTDGTTQGFTALAASDWFGGTTNVAFAGFGRVGRDNNLIQNNTTDPRLYQIRLALLATNATKQIQSIGVAKTTTLGVLNIMAVTINSTVTATLPGVGDVVLHAYPNPAAATLTVQVPTDATAATVQLLNLTGKALQLVPVRNREARFNLENLAAGFYLVRYQDGNRTCTLKVVKQ